MRYHRRLISDVVGGVASPTDLLSTLTACQAAGELGVNSTMISTWLVIFPGWPTTTPPPPTPTTPSTTGTRSVKQDVDVVVNRFF